MTIAHSGIAAFCIVQVQQLPIFNSTAETRGAAKWRK
jgi:hypothetical protein